MAKKKAPAKKKPVAGIQLDIDLGPVKATPDQIARLKARLESHVITWVTAELGNKTLPPINCGERPPIHNKPPGGGDNGG